MKRYWHKYKGLVIAAVVLILISSVAQVAFNFLIGILLDKAVEGLNISYRWLSVALIAMVLIKSYTFYAYTRNIKFFSVRSIGDMRWGIFDSILRGGFPRFIQRKTGELLSLYTHNLDTIESSYFFSFYGSFQIIGATLMAFIGLLLIDWQLGLIALALLVPPVFAPRLLKKPLANTLKRRLEALEKNTGSFSQWLQSLDVIKNYQAEERFSEKFSAETKTIQKHTVQYNLLAYLSHSLATLLSHVGLLALIALTAQKVINGDLSAGMFLTVIALMQEMQGQIIYQAGYMQQIMTSKVATEEVLKTIDEETELLQKPLAQAVQSICFENLSFSYDESRKILEDLTFDIKEKGIYLISGESGSGKSTAMNLLAGYHEPNSGQVTINDVPASQVANLPQIMTIMRQEAVFFNDTLRNNLAMYHEVSDDLLLGKMTALGLEKYANKHYLDRIMSNEGGEFSGGEARRLSLVRSLLKSSEILILDEPLANLDELSMQKIIDLILDIDDKFVFIISHQIPEKLAQHAVQAIHIG